MKTKVLIYIRSRLFFASPWILAAAAGLLVTIVVTFAFHNYRLEKQLVTDAMIQKAKTVMRAVQSGARASYLADLRKDYWESDSWLVHVQRVIDHLVDDGNIGEIGLVNERGEIIAHSKRDRIGGRSLTVPPRTNNSRKTPKILFFITSGQTGRLFEAISPFKPILTNRPDNSHVRSERPSPFYLLERMWKQSARRLMPDMRVLNRQYYISVGLGMEQYDKTVGRLRFQLFILSVAVLLVGLGGWISLTGVQGYRVSQKTLSEIKAFTSQLVATLPVGIVATDRMGRVAVWNRKVESLTGVSRENAVGKIPQKLIPPQLTDFFGEKNDRVGKKAVDAMEKEVRIRLGGEDFVLLCRKLPVYDGEGEYAGEMLLLSDISRIKLLETKMRESERLAAIGKMAGGVAHEVRNPLSSIKGLALLLKSKFRPGSKERDTADLLIQETERMNRTISDMLSFTTPVSLQCEPVDIPKLLQRELELLKAEIDAADITVSLDLAPHLKKVNGDKDRLTQVVMNILLNSLHAVEKGGRIHIEAGAGEEETMVEIRITDTGEGMDKETLHQVFFPYFTTKNDGTGLGLAISQRIVADHNGTITLDSEPGKGTTVLIRLPSV